MSDARAGSGRWTIAAAIALGGHAVAAGMVLASRSAISPAPPPEPVMLIELPADAAPTSAPTSAPAPAPAAQREVRQEPASIRPPAPVPAPVPIDVPQLRAPGPVEVAALPLPQPASTRAEPASQPAPQPATTRPAPPEASGAGTGTTAGGDPRARRQEADYFALVSAHLNRKKRYPIEAKKARQQGVVTVRFTVARDGTVSNVAIKRSSGHALLDTATTDLLAQVSPLPRMPASMARDRVTLSLPIEYALKTD
ncbi:TonB family protein [Sphingomonas sp.]|uniref:energy transducer TonB n=1 Tax=Sphingomonas sp. TaxID=28214 RepID=UPI001ED7517F|nr:TonB family protein [Sphingomonas sp.]MBX3593314.1 TonB family protein [Sphingomonas sp.]